MPPPIYRKIAQSGLSIDDSLDDRPDLYIDDVSLQRLLQRALGGMNLALPLRTRSKAVKTAVCQALGYPVPSSFQRTRPRFLGQNFDTFVQKANNLQIWNDEICASRRYVLMHLNVADCVDAVRVVSGNDLAKLDTTGTLTHKYQARSRNAIRESRLISKSDTARVAACLSGSRGPLHGLLPIRKVYDRLATLIDQRLVDPGIDQERARGWALHCAACRALGIADSGDTGQFPDIRDQLLELKLQTAGTVDLGLVCPDSRDRLSCTPGFRHCDVRYAIFYATLDRGKVRLDHLVVVTGADFFLEFARFGGKVRNTKRQLRLPADFFA